jgi:hypothetical protein
MFQVPSFRFRVGKDKSKTRDCGEVIMCTLSWRKFKSMSNGAVELGEFECRQGGNKVSQLTLEHQSKEIAADRAATWQSVLRPQHDLCRQSKDFSINGGADHSRHILMFGDKGSRYYDVKTGLCSTLGNSFTRSIDLAAPHERACSEMSTRACRARRLRCFRKIAASLASVARLRSLSAYWRRAALTSAVRLRRRDDVSISSSKSFEVASSIAIVFIGGIISAVLDYAQGSRSIDPARG